MHADKPYDDNYDCHVGLQSIMKIDTVSSAGSRQSYLHISPAGSELSLAGMWHVTEEREQGQNISYDWRSDFLFFFATGSSTYRIIEGYLYIILYATRAHYIGDSETRTKESGGS